MKPEGILIAIGGNEEKDIIPDERFKSEFGEGLILYDILDFAGGRDCRIEIITTASDIPEVVGKRYQETFEGMGAEKTGILDIRNRPEADNPAILKRLEDADVVLFSGGDQRHISRCLRGTQAHKLLMERYYNSEIVIAGTSAGAAAMSEEMIAGGKNKNILRKNELKLDKGLGLIKEVIFDSHFIQRNRFGRLAEAAALYPDKLGVGLGEDTGVVIREGNICQIIGTGMVILFDGSNFTSNHYQDLKKNTPLSLANLTVHILKTDDRYFIREKRVEIHYNTQNFKT